MPNSLKILNLHLRLLYRALPPTLRPAYEGLMGWIKSITALLKWRNLDFFEMPFQSGDSSGKLGYLGPGLNLAFVSNLVYGEVPELQPKWQLPWWKLKLAIQRTQTECDVLIIEFPHRILRILNMPGGILALPWMRWRIDTSCSWEEIERRLHRSARDDLRRSDSIECTVSQTEKDLLFFYHKIYYPYITQRFGALAEASSLDELRYFFRYHNGSVIQVKFNGDVVASDVCFAMGNVLYDYLGGALPRSDRKLLKRATANKFVFLMRLAWEHGYDNLDLGLSRSLLNDGAGRYKRKLGASIMAESTATWGLFIKMIRTSSSVQSLFHRMPWIWCDFSGNLHGLLVDPNPMPEDDTALSALCNSWWIPGLHSLIVYTKTGNFSRFSSPPHNPFPDLGPAISWQPQDAD